MTGQDAVREAEEALDAADQECARALLEEEGGPEDMLEVYAAYAEAQRLLREAVDALPPDELAKQVPF